jgi:outer membrane protein assembly factor BamA
MFVILALLSSCKLTKYVPDDQFLLNNNSIEFIKDSSYSQGQVNIDDLNSILKQQPNRKLFLGYRFHLKLYNLSNQSRIDKAIKRKENDSIKRNERIAKKNQRKLAKNPNYKEKNQVDRKLTFGERLRTTGESPIILDKGLVEKSSKQLSVFLINKGYFDNNVNDTLIQHPRRKKLMGVIYKIQMGRPYIYKNIDLEINDSVLLEYIDSIKVESLIKEGDNFDADFLDLERQRITNFLLNNGYHYFNKEFIFFKADTSVGNNNIDLVMGIQNYRFKAEFTDTIIEKKHRQYRIDAINFQLYPDYDKDRFGDSTRIFYKDVSFSFYEKFICKPELLYNALSFNIGDLYDKTANDLTYKKLSGIGLFTAVTIQYDTTLTNGLSVFIKLKQAKNQTFTLSADGTNNEGLFGVEGSVSYDHRNIFKGAERLSISITGGVETQLLVTGDREDLTSNNSELFNTKEFGPKVSLILPKYLFINNLKILKDHANAKTEFTASLNYQRRPDFTRSIQELSYGWIFREKGPMTWHINPLLISAVDITKKAEFEQQIIDLDDQFIAASFQDHIIAGGLFSFEYNGQNDRKAINFFYMKATFESGGGLLYRFHQAINKPFDNSATNSYNLLGIRYAHFQKLSLDFRYYVPLGEKSKLVYRLAGGIGIPRENLREALPFEKSFFSGGANGMRAWRARSLGPGSFLDDDNSYDKIGDIQIEANFEARFPLISWIEGALFVDAGNIWLLNEDPLRPGGQFKKDQFISEIAIGSGFGLRMDFDFFIVRMDLAIPIKNPSVPVSNLNRVNGRWIFQGDFSERKEYHQLQFNLGIGYPF